MARRDVFMNKKLVLLFAIFFLVSGSVHAQSASRLKANIPFDFVIGSTEFNAGTYTIKPMGVGGDAVLFGSADSKEVTVVPAWTLAVDQAEADSELVFQVSGDQYSLWQIWTEGSSDVLEFYIAYTETEKLSVAQSSMVAIKATLIEP
jgi:hypothetical protein